MAENSTNQIILKINSTEVDLNNFNNENLTNDANSNLVNNKSGVEFSLNQDENEILNIKNVNETAETDNEINSIINRKFNITKTADLEPIYLDESNIF